MIDLFRSLFAPPRHFILIVAALWIGPVLAEKRTERHVVSKDTINNLTFYAALAYLIGGRVLYALANRSAFAPSPFSVFSPNPDLFDSTGGLIVVISVGISYARKQNLPLWGMLDALTPFFAFLAIGLCLSRLASGTGFGSPTTLPWGMDLWNATRHPTQIYELIASILIFGLIWLHQPDPAPGILFLRFAALTSGARLFLEAFRGDSVLAFGELRLAQIVSWTALAIALFVSESIRRKQESG